MSKIYFKIVSSRINYLIRWKAITQACTTINIRYWYLQLNTGSSLFQSARIAICLLPGLCKYNRALLEANLNLQL